VEQIRHFAHQRFSFQGAHCPHRHALVLPVFRTFKTAIQIGFGAGDYRVI